MPTRILHRDEQIQRFRAILSDLEHDVRPRNILAIGDFGTGKTAVTRSLCTSSPDGILRADVHVTYVNCSEENTQNRIIRTILCGLGIEVRPGWPSDHYLRLLKDGLSHVPWLVLILDEVDKLIDHKDSSYTELFYTLSRTTTNVVVVLLTNKVSFETQLLSSMDSRTRDTFRFERVEFGDYDATELNDILADRCRIGLNEGTYDNGTIGLAAGLVYQNGMRARGLIDLTRKAAEIAESCGSEFITESHIREAFRTQLSERDYEIIRKLAPPHRVLIAQILAKSPTSTILYDWFKNWASQNGVGPSVATYRGYLKDLETYDIVIKTKRGLGRGRGADMVLEVRPELASIVRLSLEKTNTPSTIDSVNLLLSEEPKQRKLPPSCAQTTLGCVTESEVGGER